MEALLVENDIVIQALMARVWDALTNPEQTKKYMFGCEAFSDWNVGSPLLWKGQWEGQEMIFVKGHVVRIEPPTLLAYTTFDPNSTIEDIPENYLTVTYGLSEENGQTHLHVAQGDYATVADGERRYQDSSTAAKAGIRSWWKSKSWLKQDDRLFLAPAPDGPEQYLNEKRPDWSVGALFV